MFTETSVGENAGEIKEEASLIDPDFGVGKLSVSPVPYESFCLRADESSLTMLTSHVPAADVLLSAFDSISFVEDPKQTNNITKSTTETDAAGPICEPDLHGQRIEDGKAASKSDSSEFEVVNEIDQTQEPNNPLIVYTSSRRKSARSTNKKLNQNESPKPFRNCRRISKSNSALDLNSLKISRKKRSLFSKQARAAVWGVLENVVPAEEQIGLDPNLGDEKKQRRVRGGQGKRNNIKSQTDRKSAGQTYTSTGHISLKIKIGNQTFSTANVSENRNALEKSIPGLSDIKESKLVEELPRDMVLPRENASFCTSNDLHQIISHEEGDNLRVSTENRCSDPGTSPDSEVINSVPDARLFEKDLQTVQDGNIMPMEGTSQEQSTDTVPYPSFGDVSSLSLPRMKSKKGMKKDKQHLSGNCSVESKLNGAETTNNAKTPAEFGLGQKAVGVSYCNDASINATARPCLDAYNSNGEILIVHCNGQKSPKCSRGKGGRKSTSGISDLPSKKDKASKKKGAKSNLVSKHHIDETGDASGVLSGVESHLPAGNQIPSHHGATGEQSKGPSGPISGLQFSSDGISNQYVPPRNAWVLCDECQKWRRIPAILADRIEETNCGWTCEDNTDEEFADCSIAQEKSNSEINEELDISDASCEEDACDALQKSNKNQSKAAQQSSFSLIKSNLFRHRNRKTQTIDEVMVCHCKPPPDGRMGCGAKCLNRMLNIECVQGTCPCGELCSNQQFQKRTYAKLKWFRCGKKGFGLQALQDISSGQFLIEYVGEVLDVHAYEARQIEYAVQGHKHFYFMTLNGSEVIDASAKGNLGRFINHSCDPNCRTEKWMVNGEVCVGLFAVRDIKKGEEVTFDYNFVRVFGAAAKKCVCGSPNCRGYIGGDPTNSEVVQDDSDDEFAEPVMTCEDRDMNEEWNDIMSNCLYDIENVNANEPEENEDVGQFENFTPETLVQKVGGDSASASIDGCFKTPTATEVVDVMVQDKCEPADNDFASNAVTSLPCKLQLDTTEYKRKLKYGRQKEELLKSNPLVKTRSPSSSIKKGKLKSNVVNDKGTSNVDKSNAVVLQKSKKLPEVSVNSHVETVEDKLNELLDKEGGISKRKDASRGYLKLLFLTAASGTNGHGEAIQSNRDLSMILDALLKTKSRTVLVDITNKNGLQMLHNIMKRYRKEFIKTPILRKLLRVLEYLAMREILTLEHITGGPPCPGFESFKDSILTLTEHADKQVHQIARNFRDRWIPRSLRRSCFMDIDDGKSDIHQRSSYYGRLAASSHDHWSDRGGKPAESCNVEASSAPASASTSGTNQTRTRKRKSRWDNPDDDIPPGFSPPCNSSTVPFGTVLGNSQQRFAARIPLSYGVPFSVMQQFGVLQAENVALGLPFHPFPPLPPAEKAEQNEMMMSSRTGPPETNFSDQQDFQRDSYNLGRKYFRQQKWNNSKLAPPWVRMRNNGNQFRNSYNSEEFNRRGAEF